MTTTDAVFFSKKREKKREKKKREKKREREKIQQLRAVYIYLWVSWLVPHLVSWVSATLKYVYVRSAKPRNRESSKWRGVCQLHKSLGMFGVSCPAYLFHTKEEERERERKTRERRPL